MEEPKSEKRYEDSFEFPLWRLVKQRAEKDDISYVEASKKVVPEYVKTIKYRDIDFENASIEKRVKEKAKLTE
ncbi:MAG TPA: hypothetical protein VMW86_05800 [Dehalococcoidales bacterium]|nr:hypothetical protein [Dehalococcoidales bacterium]